MVVPLESEIEDKESWHGSKNWVREDFKLKSKFRETGCVETHGRMEPRREKNS
jgi:hypothetical protein